MKYQSRRSKELFEEELQKGDRTKWTDFYMGYNLIAEAINREGETKQLRNLLRKWEEKYKKE